MTLIERAVVSLRLVIGDALAARIRSNLPSRKPQLWEAPIRSAYRRLQRRVRLRFDRHWKDRKVVVRLTGSDLLMELTPRNEDLDLPLLLFGQYEISGTRFVQTFLRPGMTFVDIGANSGYYSLVASRAVGPTGYVLALEPAAGPFSKFVRNIEMNSLSNVRALRVAAGRSRGTALLYGSADTHNDGLGSLIPAAHRISSGSEVPVVALDDLMADLPGRRADLLKIDVEGTESEVLAGGQALLSQPHPPALLFESFKVGPVAGLLAEKGYEVRHVHFSLPRGVEFPRLSEPFDNCFEDYEPPNFVALKSVDAERAFGAVTAASMTSGSKVLRLLARMA